MNNLNTTETTDNDIGSENEFEAGIEKSSEWFREENVQNSKYFVDFHLLFYRKLVAWISKIKIKLWIRILFKFKLIFVILIH